MKNYNKILEAVNRGILLALDDFDDNELIGQQTLTIKDDSYMYAYMDAIVNRIIQIPINNTYRYNIDPNVRKAIRKEYKILLSFYQNNQAKYIALTREDLKNLIQRIVLIDKDADLNWIDTSHITNMMCLFGDFLTYDFCGDVSSWDTSNVTNMWQMFYRCGKFNCDISNWNTSKVKNMSMMFCCCTHFNLPVGKWDVSSVTDMGSLFSGCRDFNLDLSNWDTHNVKNMTHTFNRCVKFDLDLSMWDVSNVTDINGFSYNAKFAKTPQKLPHFDKYKTRDPFFD